MDVLNLVVNILHLIVDVVIGVAQVTWMISKDVFHERPEAKHYSHDKNKRPPHSSPTRAVVCFCLFDCRIRS